MYTLFIDTHSDKIIIVFYKENKVIYKKEGETKQNHSVTVMPILVEALKATNLELQDLNEIIVVHGPGSFTGVRVGVTIAKTLSYTLNIPIKVMSSLLVKAVSFSHENITILEKEKNGYYIGSFDKNNQLINKYQYMHKNNYQTIENSIEEVDLNYENIILFAKSLDYVNPHSVKPLYVKQIEVQK